MSDLETPPSRARGLGPESLPSVSRGVRAQGIVTGKCCPPRRPKGAAGKEEGSSREEMDRACLVGQMHWLRPQPHL